MTYNIKIIKKQGQETFKWTGGKTTQLYIYPENSSYEKRNFKWRLSSATIEVEESKFTKLPNIQRKLMLLDGDLVLNHDNKRKINLKKFDVDSFSGDVDTKSYGKCRDFNLMTNKDCRGDLEHLKLESNIVLEYGKNNNNNYKYRFDCFYSIDNCFEILLETGKALSVEAGDLLLIKTKNECKNKFEIVNRGEETVDIIKSTVYY